ncbi:MAG: hypothetical protein ACLFVT_07690, partial [Syntrophobacteria bacterium]
MRNNLDHLTREKDLAFTGKVTAGLSHEIKNTLAVINESVGLMGDLLEQVPHDDSPAYPRLKTIVANLEDQVQRSGLIVKRLNRFAHRMDRPLASVDLNEMVEEITALSERFAKLQRVELKAGYAPEPLPIVTDPFRLQRVIFKFIELALTYSPAQTKVTVASGRSGERLQVCVTDQGPSRVDVLRNLVAGSPPA